MTFDSNTILKPEPDGVVLWDIPNEHVEEFKLWMAAHPKPTRYELDMWMIDHGAKFAGEKKP